MAITLTIQKFITVREIINSVVFSVKVGMRVAFFSLPVEDFFAIFEVIAATFAF